jgi:hypothetical protein
MSLVVPAITTAFVPPVSGTHTIGVAGRHYPIRIEFTHTSNDAFMRLLWHVPGRNLQAEAVEAARGALGIFVGGKQPGTAARPGASTTIVLAANVELK